MVRLNVFLGGVCAETSELGQCGGSSSRSSALGEHLQLCADDDVVV